MSSTFAEMAEALKVYGEGLGTYQLQGQVLLPGFNTSRLNIDDLISFFQSIDDSHELLLSEIYTLVKLWLVMPATNAASERSCYVT